MGTRVGREAHGEEEEEGGRARHEGSWRVMKIFRVLRAARDAFFFAPTCLPAYYRGGVAKSYEGMKTPACYDGQNLA